VFQKIYPKWILPIIGGNIFSEILKRTQMHSAPHVVSNVRTGSQDD